MAALTGRKTYRIQLSLPLALLLLLLAIISLAATFYMGLVAGKSLREPPESPVVSVPQEPLSELEKTESLEFFKLNKEPSVREELDREMLKKLTGKKHDTGEKEKTPETLFQEGKSSEARKETEPGKKTRAVKSVKAPSPPKNRQVERPFVETPRKPEVAIKKVQPVKPVKQVQPLEYTVQVFSGRKRKNAEKLVKRLKDKGFTGAYIYQYLSKEGVTFYRVRIGRMEKTGINVLSKRIKALDFIDSIKVTRY